MRTAHAVPVANSLAASTSCKKEKSNSVKSFDTVRLWYGEADEDHRHVADGAPFKGHLLCASTTAPAPRQHAHAPTREVLKPEQLPRTLDVLALQGFFGDLRKSLVDPLADSAFFVACRVVGVFP